MRRLLSLFALAAALVLPASASAAFAIEDFDVTFTGPNGETVTQAGSHPFAMTTSFGVATEPTGNGGIRLAEAVKDIETAQMKGFVGNPTAVPPCSTADFLTAITAPGGFFVPDCPDSAAVGTVKVEAIAAEEIPDEAIYSAVFNLEPPPGVAAKLGFWNGGVPVTIELGVNSTSPYNIVGGPTNVSQIIEVAGAELVLWGVPADQRHDPERGICLDSSGVSLGECPANISVKPFLTMPRSCEGPLATGWEADSWLNPGKWISGSVLTHDEVGNPVGMSGCGKLDFAPEANATPSTRSAESPAGLEFTIEVEDEGLQNPDGIAAADYTEVITTLPLGVTANPGAAEGLGVCTAAQFAAASLENAGCPGASKLGTLEVVTPLLENRTLPGSIYLAQPDDPSTAGSENPFDSLIALYFMIREPELGVFTKLPVEVQTDAVTGRILTIVRDIPPFPLSRVTASLRAGPRAPLITPPVCGSYATTTTMVPSSGADPLTTTSSFDITSGPGGGTCPPGGLAPFSPGFEAGSLNNAAGAFSPFAMRLTRSDGAQDLTRFSAILPPGVSGKIAGIPQCSDAAIAAARTKTGRAELAQPSCASDSRLGSVLTGAGVGSALTYVPGDLYLAGPYNSAPLSVVAIVPAVAGPFDAGTVVTRVALRLNPNTAEVEVDGAASDPIPHILKGIPLKVRDIRIVTDRPGFTLNPTSCEPSSTRALIYGSYADVLSPLDDQAVGASSRFQAASCASLPFKPKLSLSLKGKTTRSANTALRAVLTARGGDANLKGAIVTLPPSQFIDNAHIANPCTRAQFAADACPPASILGNARAFTPLLDAPLEGPVYFRSNGGERNLPDVVADLNGQFRFVLVIAILRSTNARVRTKVLNAPDAPVSKFVLNMAGGRKSLLENSENLCLGKQRVSLNLIGQNGARMKANPVVKTDCKAKPSRARR